MLHFCTQCQHEDFYYYDPYQPDLCMFLPCHIRHKCVWRLHAERLNMHSDGCLIVYTHTKSPLQDHPPSQQLKYFMMSSPPRRVAKRRHQSSPEYQFVFTVGLIVSLCGRRPVIFLLITMRSSRRTQHIHSQDRFTLMQLNGSSGGHRNTLRANIWTMDFDEY